MVYVNSGKTSFENVDLVKSLSWSLSFFFFFCWVENLNVVCHQALCSSNTLWTITCWAPLPMEVSGQENRLPFPIAVDLNPGIEPTSHVSYIGKQILYHYATWETHLCKGLYSSKLTGVERSYSAPPSKGCAWVTIELCQALLQAAGLWERGHEGWGLVGSHLEGSLDLHCAHKGNFTRWQVEYLVQKPLGSRYKGIF